MALAGKDVDRIISRLFVLWSHPRLSSAFREQHVPREPATCIISGRLRVPATAAAVHAAVCRLIERIPRLASRYYAGVWRPLAAPVSETAARILQVVAECVPAEALARHFSPSEGPAWQLFFAPPSDLIIAFSHALSDGLGMSFAGAELLAGLGGEAPAALVDHGNHGPLDAAWMQREIARREHLAKVAPTMLASAGPVTWAQARTPIRDLQRAVERARVSVPTATSGDVLLAALHAALGASAERDTVVVKATADVRGEAPAPLTVGNQTVQAFIVSDRAQRREPAALWRCVAEQMASARGHKRELPEVDLSAPTGFRSIGTDAIFSNMAGHAQALLGSGFSDASGGVMPTLTAPRGSFFAFTWNGELGLSKSSCSDLAQPRAEDVLALLRAWGSDG